MFTTFLQSCQCFFYFCTSGFYPMCSYFFENKFGNQHFTSNDNLLAEYVSEKDVQVHRMERGKYDNVDDDDDKCSDYSDIISVYSEMFYDDHCD